MTINRPLQFSNSIKTILLEGFEEIVGGVNLAFNNPDQLAYEFDGKDIFEIYCCPDKFDNVKRMFLRQFGELGSRGIAIRAGEASFRSFIRLNGNGSKLTGLDYRLMNSNQRCLFGLKQISLFIKQNCGIAINVNETNDSWHIEVLENEQIQDWNELMGDFLLGLFREYFIWTSGGRFYILETQSEDLIENQLYVININKQPLGN